MNNIVDVTFYQFAEMNLQKNEIKKIDDVWQKVKECYQSVQVPFAQEDTDHDKGIGMKY